MRRFVIILIMLLSSVAFPMWYGEHDIGDYLTFAVNTSQFSTGAGFDSTSVPQYGIYEDETAAEVVGPAAMAKLDDAGTIGFYTERVQLTEANFDVGKMYTIYITATVDGVAATTYHAFKMRAAPIATVTALADVPTVAEFEARSIVAADYVVVGDTIAAVTLLNGLAANVITTASINDGAITDAKIATIGVNVVSEDNIDFGALKKTSLDTAADTVTVTSMGANVITAASTHSDFSTERVDDVWDAVITKANHNVANSAGKKLRQVEDTALIREEEQAQGGTASTIILHNDASTINGFYDDAQVVIVSDLGVGQSRHIHAYVGSTRVASITPDWITSPDATSDYVLKADSEKHVHEIDTNAINAASTSSDYLAEINAEVDTALADINLDHLVNIAVDTSLTNTVHDNSVIGYMLASTNVTNYVRTDDSLQAISEAAGSAANVWAYGTRVLTASTNFNDLSAAEVNTEVDNAIITYNLDHLMLTAVASNADMTTEVPDGTVLSNLMSATSDTSTFVVADDSLQGISEGAAGGGASAQEVWEYITRGLTDESGFSLASDQSGVTIGTVNTLTGHTVQTGDSYAITNSGTYGLSALYDILTNVTYGLSAIRTEGDASWTTGTGDGTSANQTTMLARLAAIMSKAAADPSIGTYDPATDSLEAQQESPQAPPIFD